MNRKLTLLGLAAVFSIVAAACNADTNGTDDSTGGSEPTEHATEATTETTEEATETGATTEEAEAETAEATDEETTPDATETEESAAGTGEVATGEVVIEEGPAQVTLTGSGMEASNGETRGDRLVFTSGQVAFDVTNDTDETNTVAVDRQGDTDELAGGDEENAAQLPLIWSSTIPAGETRTWEIELEPGDYVLYSPIGEQRDEGVELEFTIEAGE